MSLKKWVSCTSYFNYESIKTKANWLFISNLSISTWVCTFNNYFPTFLCLFMLVHYMSCYSLIIPTLHSNAKSRKSRENVRGGEGKYLWLLFHHHFPFDSALRMLVERFFFFLFSSSRLSLLFFFFLFFFFGINIHTRFVWCYSYLLLCSNWKMPSLITILHRLSVCICFFI